MHRSINAKCMDAKIIFFRFSISLERSISLQIAEVEYSSKLSQVYTLFARMSILLRPQPFAQHYTTSASPTDGRLR